MSFRRLGWLALVAGLAACDDRGTSDAGAPDFAVASDDLSAPVADLATSDLSLVCSLVDAARSTADAAGLCDGTALAGTCAQGFFEQLAECFVPEGCCWFDGSAHTPIYAWASGAYMSQDNISPPGFASYRQNGMTCAERAGDQWTLYDGTKLTLDPATGDVTCPDGSSANIGTSWRDCPAFVAAVGQIYGPIPFPPLACSVDCCAPYRPQP